MERSKILSKLNERKKMFEDYLQQIKNRGSKQAAAEKRGKKADSAIK